MTYKIISADSHMCEPLTLWVDRIDKRFRDQAPRVVKDPGDKKGHFFMWSTDYPHQASTFPHTQETLEKAFQDVPEADKHKITRDNASKLYGLPVE